MSVVLKRFALWPKYLLIGFAVLFFILFTAKGLLIHGNMGTSAYDLGIFDQAFWRYSRFLDQFNTVRGLPILGDHFSPIAFVFAPLYWLVPTVAWPIAVQTFSVALGGVILFYLVLARLSGLPWLALGFALSYFLHPAVHNTLLWQYHEIVLASGLYLGLIWCYVKDRWWPFVFIIFLLLACREDMPFTLAAFGCLALTEKRWRYGIVSICLAVLWWLMVVKWLMPLFNGQGYFRHVQGTLGMLFANWHNPRFYLERLSDPRSMMYLWQVFFPFGFLAMLSPRFLLPALPTLAANVLIGGYNTQIGYHYSVSVMPFLFWGALESIRAHRQLFDLDKGRAAIVRVGALTLACVSASGWFYFQYSVLYLGRFPDQWNALSANASKRHLLASIDRNFPNLGISASDFLLPHLSHRELIYLFPNPWQIRYWGIAGEKPHHPNAVDLIVLNRDLYSESPELIDYLVDSGIFHRDRDESGIMVLRRLRPEAEDRNQAIIAFQKYMAMSALPFVDVALSPIFATTESQFRRIDVPQVLLQDHAPPDWQPLTPTRPTFLNIDLTEGKASGYETRYVRAVLTVDEPMRAVLAIGSDDGVTVWLNGRNIHENIVLRPAHPGDDRVQIDLATGKNVLVFRVNNAGGAWRLIAKVQPYRRSGTE
ncbi:MAG: DUF2079 domain-containing protein [Betaproteobacteria bacterium]|nr:MAG: DUF2079 domain-containing protein [Betaproteobacteria bacterium]